MRYKILVIEDDPVLREMLSRAMDCAGFRYDTASDGSEALEKIQTCQPDAIVLDVMMPHMDGFTFLAEMRLLNIHVPVVVITASLSAAAQASFLMADTYQEIVGVFVKPFKIAQVLATLGEVVMQRQTA